MLANSMTHTGLSNFKRI